MAGVIKIEELVPSFNLYNGTGKTLGEWFDKNRELRERLVQNMLKDYCADEQRMIEEFCKEYNNSNKESN